MNRERATPSGFTLIELLVLISILTVLVGLLLPVLRSARTASIESQCDGHLRATLQDAIVISGGQSGIVPSMEWAGLESYGSVPRPGLQLASDGGTVQFPYFGHGGSWMIELIDAGRPAQEAWACPGLRLDLFRREQDEQPAGFVVLDAYSNGLAALWWARSYVMSDSFLSGPTMWRADGPSSDGLLRLQSLADVRFPGQKALLYEDSGRHASRATGLRGGGERIAIGTADGSVRREDRAMLRAGVVNPFHPEYGAVPLRQTEWGVYGRDL